MQPGDRAPTWREIARAHWQDHVAILVLVVILAWSETAHPFMRVIFHNNSSELELWRYSYPLFERNTVPSWSVPLISTLAPVAVLVAWYVAVRPSRVELHQAILGAWSAVFATAVITNLVKVSVGRPRPDFVERCWPDGKPVWSEEGTPVCEQQGWHAGEGLKSFPSGHTSWTTSGLGFLSLWLAGKLRCFDGSGHPWRLLVSALPLSFAVWTGITRLQDYWHHWEDVTVGFLLGLTMAYLSYRQHYPSLLSRRAGEAYCCSAWGETGQRRSDLLPGYNDFEDSASADEAV